MSKSDALFLTEAQIAAMIGAAKSAILDSDLATSEKYAIHIPDAVELATIAVSAAIGAVSARNANSPDEFWF